MNGDESQIGDTEPRGTTDASASDDPGRALMEMREALSAASRADDAPTLARLLLARVRRELIPRASPLDALRTAQRQRAWRLADLTDDGRRYLWRLLLAWELQGAGEHAEARACLASLRGRPLPDFGHDEDSCAAFLLLNLLGLDRDLVTELYQTMTEVGDYFPRGRDLSALCGQPHALELARALPNPNRRDEALQAAAKAQMRAGDPTAATETARQLSSPRQRAAALISIAEGQAHAGDTVGSRTTLFTALTIGERMKRRRDEVLTAIAAVFVQIGDLTAAQQMAPRIRHPEWRGEIEAAVAGVLAQRGEMDSAAQMAARIRFPVCRAGALVEIARAQLRAADPAAARLSLNAARQAAEAIPSPAGQPQALVEIGVVQTQAGDEEGADRDFAALLERARSVRSSESRAWMLHVVGLGQLRAGARAAGEGTLAAARAEALRIEDRHLRSKSLRSLATAEAEAGEFGIARETAAGIEDPHQRSRAEAAIAAAQTRSGEWSATLETIGSIEETEVRTLALRDLAAAQREAGAPGAARLLLTARETAAQAKQDWSRPRLLHDIALAQLEAGDPAAARETFAVMLMVAQESADRSRRDAALVVLAIEQAKAGAIAGALETAGAISDDGGSRYTAMAEIARAQAQAGELETAWGTVEQMVNSGLQAEALATVVATQVRSEGREQQSLGDALDRILQIAGRLEDGGDRSCMLIDVATDLARIGAFLPALEVALAIDWDDRRAMALGEIAARQGQAGEREASQLTLAAALESARRVPHAWWRVDPLLAIAEALVKIGERLPALAALEAARVEADAIEDKGGRDDELLRIAEAQAKARDFAAALATVQRVLGLPQRAVALASIALAQTQAGAPEAAEATLRSAAQIMGQIDPPDVREDALALIARTQARLGAFSTALETAQQIRFGYSRMEVLHEIAALQAEAGERDAARATIAAALEISHGLKASCWGSQALAEAAKLQARLGWGADAVQTAAAIGSEQDEYWPEIAVALADSGDRESFKRLLILGAVYPNAAGKMALLLPRLYPEQASELRAIIRSGSAS